MPQFPSKTRLISRWWNPASSGRNAMAIIGHRFSRRAGLSRSGRSLPGMALLRDLQYPL